MGDVPSYLYDVGDMSFDQLEHSSYQNPKNEGYNDGESYEEYVNDDYSDIILSSKNQLNKGKDPICDDDPSFVK